MTGPDPVPTPTFDEKWAGEVEHVAAWMFRVEHGWRPEAIWGELSTPERTKYLVQARTIGYMFGFPYASEIVAALGRLCPCNVDPETTDGPERECPLHGDHDWAALRLLQAERIAEMVKRYIAAPTESDIPGNAGEIYDQLVALASVYPPP